MAFGHWQIGLHIQQDSALSVALSSGRSGRALRRWWHIPLPAGTVDNGRLKAPQQLFSALQPWRDALPQRHQVRLAFPAARTLQKKLPRPAMFLREKALTTWLSHAVARELEMSTDDLRFDYAEDSLEQAWSVTAAQRREVAELLEMAKKFAPQPGGDHPGRLRATALHPLFDAPRRLRCLAGRGTMAVGDTVRLGAAGARRGSRAVRSGGNAWAGGGADNAL
ncbi:DNA utilization protein HofM [Phytobacter massiliensis]|uniref:DNA utilization protein HofM n=1 Tax=Phytobacter massiliensis TaxID=1485952 RepID=UPI0003007692